MSDFVIRAEGLSKRYRIGLKEEKKSKTFAGQMIGMVTAPFQNFKQLSSMTTFKNEDESVFWALQNVNFSVNEGEVLGIIGRNGAGKSTLLKILSRITEPTTGNVLIKGRVASLLEVGTGFHPELTGRENIYMNGTILGMTKREIDRKIDEIIEFSGIEKFVDTAVKFFSSGMKVRLGFSVAAHLEPEILIIDEVLAVGDVEFQRKCLGKMQNVAQSGRTVLFVSHGMAAIRNLCTQCMVLSKGGVVFQGDVDKAVDMYIAENSNSSLSSMFVKGQVQNNVIEVIKGEIVDRNYRSKGEFNADEEIIVILTCTKNLSLPGISGYFVIRNDSDEVYIETDTHDFLPNVLDSLELGTHRLELRIPPRVLPKGRFKVYLNFVSPFTSEDQVLDSPRDILAFEIYDTTTARGARRRAHTNAIIQWTKVIN